MDLNIRCSICLSIDHEIVKVARNRVSAIGRKIELYTIVPLNRAERSVAYSSCNSLVISKCSDVLQQPASECVAFPLAIGSLGRLVGQRRFNGTVFRARQPDKCRAAGIPLDNGQLN